ncbi:MAG: tyrosine-type recombinase/integrase, partial [Bacilli bacterium]
VVLANFYKYVDKKGKTSWRVRFYIPAADGERKQLHKAGFLTKKEAEKWHMDYMSELMKGKVISDKKLTLRDWLLQWERDYVSVNNSPKTHEGYSGIIRAHIIPALGSVKISDLSVSHIQNYVAETRKKYSARYTRNHLSVLKKSLHDAVRAGLVASNVSDNVDQPRQVRPNYYLYSAEQMLSYLQALENSQYHALVVTAVATGMRRGELMALTWDDIDLVNNLVRINKAETSASRSFKKGKEEATKTKRPRTVTIAGWLSRYLSSYKEEYKSDSSDLVFVSWKTGHGICQTEIGRYLNRIQDKVGLKRMRFHDLRHWHASVLVEAGTDIATIQQRLGHSRASTTLDIYIHLFGIHDERPANIIGSALGFQ